MANPDGRWNIRDNGIALTVTRIDTQAKDITMEINSSGLAVISPRLVVVNCVPPTVDVAVGSYLGWIDIPEQMNGFDLVNVWALHHFSGGSAGATSVQINRLRAEASVICLSTLLTIDFGERSSADAAVPPVVNSNDDAISYDAFSVEVTALPTGAAPTGLTAFLNFEKP